MDLQNKKLELNQIKKWNLLFQAIFHETFSLVQIHWNSFRKFLLHTRQLQNYLRLFHSLKALRLTEQQPLQLRRQLHFLPFSKYPNQLEKLKDFQKPPCHFFRKLSYGEMDIDTYMDQISYF